MSGDVRGKSKLYEADRQQVSERIIGRKSVFLDSNVWIDFAEEKQPDSLGLRHLLLQLVQDGKIFCPLSAPLIWELYKQDPDSRLRCAELMEKASLNVCYALNDEIFRTEVVGFLFKALTGSDPPTAKSRIYVPIFAYLSSSFTIEYPPPWSEEQIAKFEELAIPKMSGVSLTEFVRMRGERLPDLHRRVDPSRFDEATRKRWAKTGSSRKKMWRMEEEEAARSYVLPVLSRFPFPIQILLQSRLELQCKDEHGGQMRRILDLCPALKNYVELMVVSGLDIARRTRPSDFFDVDMVPAPLTYADAFFSRDKWIRDMITRRGAFLQRTRCQFFSTSLDFRRFLESL